MIHDSHNAEAVAMAAGTIVICVKCRRQLGSHHSGFKAGASRCTGWVSHVNSGQWCGNVEIHHAHAYDGLRKWCAGVTAPYVIN